MKKLFFAAVALMMICSCSQEPKTLVYKGLPMDMPFQSFCDSLMARGFAVDSAKTDSAFTRVVMFKEGELYRMMLAQQDGKVTALQENYHISTNDSTRRLWQDIRDGLEKELGTWPNCPMLKDNHKIAKFETEGGFITVTLENTYRPTLEVLYSTKGAK